MLEKERFLAIKKLANKIRKDNEDLFKALENVTPEEAIREKEEFIEKIIDSMGIRFEDGEQGREEKQIFMQLITVSGVGPKMAITILSGMKISDLIIAISREDVTLLSKIKGLGKKTAERICLELKDKIGNGGDTNLFNYNDTNDFAYNETALNDAVDTLITLGVNKNEAYKLARSNAGDNATAEEIILKVLRQLGR